MLIAIDFDKTYTEDPAVWDAVISMLRLRGHTVICITCRRDTPENREIVHEAMIDSDPLVIFTSLAPKKDKAEALGYKVDVWIDDDPITITQGH